MGMNSLPAAALVFLGAGLGGVGRFAVGLALPPIEGRWPSATFSVNLAGCFFAGLLAPFVLGSDPRSETLRLFLGVGILGGFTTFSAFSRETVALASGGQPKMAASYAVASLITGVLLTGAGWWLAHALRKS